MLLQSLCQHQKTSETSATHSVLSFTHCDMQRKEPEFALTSKEKRNKTYRSKYNHTHLKITEIKSRSTQCRQLLEHHWWRQEAAQRHPCSRGEGRHEASSQRRSLRRSVTLKRYNKLWQLCYTSVYVQHMFMKRGWNKHRYCWHMVSVSLTRWSHSAHGVWIWPFLWLVFMLVIIVTA